MNNPPVNDKMTNAQDEQLAEAHYRYGQPEGDSQLTQGLAVTYEQIQDGYRAGTSDGMLRHEDGLTKISREGGPTE